MEHPDPRLTVSAWPTVAAAIEASLWPNDVTSENARGGALRGKAPCLRPLHPPARLILCVLLSFAL